MGTGLLGEAGWRGQEAPGSPARAPLWVWVPAGVAGTGGVAERSPGSAILGVASSHLQQHSSFQPSSFRRKKQDSRGTRKGTLPLTVCFKMAKMVNFMLHVYVTTLKSAEWNERG